MSERQSPPVPASRLIAGQAARGFAMGAADIVPGVSGGTVALVLGIYERLIDNVRAAAGAAGHVLRGQPREALRRLRVVEWVWLISLLAGIGVAVAALSSVLEQALDDHPVKMGALFFGLVVGSSIVAVRLVRRWDPSRWIALSVTAAGLFALLGLRTDTHSTASEAVTTPLLVFALAGALAICAMILPGISGSFILVMIGMYGEILGAVNDRDLVVLLAFTAGCAVGLGAFSTALTWMLTRHHDVVMAAMIGLMLGSLRVLWPWPGGTGSTSLGAPRDDIAMPVLIGVAGLLLVLVVDAVATRRSHGASADAADAA